MECRIPMCKLIDTKKLVSEWLCKRSAKKVQLQSLIGSLQFVAKCVKPGRVFIGRMLHVLRKLKRKNHKFSLTAEIKKDLLWWKNFLEKCNDITMIPEILWSKPDLVLSTDACLVGCGGICKNEYFQAAYPPFIKEMNLSINALEMLTVTVSIKLWADRLSKKRIIIYCDNQVTVQAINTGRAKDKFLLKN